MFFLITVFIMMPNGISSENLFLKSNKIYMAFLMDIFLVL